MAEATPGECAAFELLIHCANASIGAPHLRATVIADARRIEDGNGWEQVLAIAGHHGLLPGLTTALHDADWPSVPDGVRQRLERRQQLHVKTTLLQVAALRSICARFQAAEVRVASWKGPLLAQALYGSFVARESGDLDFLMDPDEFTVAASLLKSMGFRRHSKARSIRLDKKIARLDGDQGFYRRGDGVYVELHVQPMPARFTAWQSRRAYMERAVWTQVTAQTRVLTLLPEDLLLSLASHAIKHHWERLKWVQDIALFLRVYQTRLDWAALLQATRRTGKSRALVHSLALAKSVFGAEVPQTVQDATEWAQTASITQHIAQVLRLQSRGNASEQENTALMGLLQPSKLSKLHFTVKRALEPQLCDFNDDFSRSPLVCKWNRVLRQTGTRGVLTRAALTLRKAR